MWGRGGGSIEDLWAFNEEIVARAIFECSTPIISAVGHETDFTIADFAADLRAPTPSAAAELAVDDYRSVIEAVSIYRQRLYRAMSGKMDLYRSRLEHFQTKFAYLSPENRLREQRQRLADLENAVQNGMNRKLQDERHRLSVYLERFAGLSPLKKLNQGYSYVADKYKKTLTSVEQVQNGDTIYISVTDGTIEADVTGTVKRGENLWRRKKTVSSYRRRNLWKRCLQNWICWLKNWKTETHRWRTLLYCTDRAWNF